MRSRRSWRPLVCAVVVAALALPVRAATAPVDPASSRPMSVAELVELGLRSNLELQAAAADVEAARARESGASLLLRDNPELTTSAGPRWNNDNDSVDWSVGVEQRIEIAGQRAARRQAASAGLDAAQRRMGGLRSALAADIREAHASVVATTALAALADDELAIARSSLDAAEERFRAGDASRIEENSARIELGRATTAQADAATARDGAIASLRALIGSEVVASLHDEERADTPCERPADELLAAARRRGDLLAAAAELEQAEAEQKLAQREAIASPSVGVAYEREEESDIVRATIRVPLPLFDRNQSARGVAAAELGRARLAARSAELAMERDVARSLAECRSAGAAMSAYTGGVAQAAASNLELAMEGYRAGKVDFLQLQIIRREALEARRSEIESVRRWKVADAQLRRAIGSWGEPAS